MSNINDAVETIRTFDFEAKTVTLNSGYEMPINGLGTYNLHGEECVNAVKSAIEQGVRLIDTVHMYGNEEEIGQAIMEKFVESGQIRSVGLSNWYVAELEEFLPRR